MQNKSKITFINIVALFGYALLAFTSFMGAMFATGGSLGVALAVSLGSVVVLALIIKGARYAKGADSDFAKWRKVEIALVIAFWAVGVFPARYSAHFLMIVTSNEQLHAVALADAGEIERMFGEYEAFENNALSITRVGLETALGQPMDAPLGEYMKNASVTTPDQLESWMLTQRGLLLGREGVDGFSYIDYREKVDSVVNDWVAMVNARDLMFMASHGSDLQSLADEVASRLTDTSKAGQLPGVEFANGLYCAHPLEQTVTVESATMKFAGELSGLSATVVGYIAAAFMLLLIFLDYLMSYRSGRTEIHRYDVSEGNVL